MKSFESGRQPDPHYIAEMNGPDQADLTWIKGSTQEKYISEGFFGEAHTYILESENGDIELVRKTKRRFDDKRNKIEEAFTPQEIATQLEVHRLLKEHGIKTFDNFYTDGRSFYSTLLNKDGVTAISANTKNRPPNPESGDSFLKSLRIANYRELVNDIFNQVFLMVEAKICINHDSFFFLVPNNFTDTAIDIDFVIHYLI